MLLIGFFINFATENRKLPTMAKKKTPKAKEPVRLRYKKLANGNTSLYLDCYRAGQRTYEFLHLYLVSEKTPADKIANANTLEAAMAIKAERITEIINGEAGLTKRGNKGKILLTDWMLEVGRRKKSTSATSSYRHAVVYIQETKGGRDLKLQDVTRDFCLRFLEHLRTAKMHAFTHGRHILLDKTLCQSTQAHYATALSTALNDAVEADIIKKNPMKMISVEDKPHAPKESKRQFLTQEELVKMANADCPNEQVKKAFIFGCLTGLRISDIRRLTWGAIQKDKEDKFVYFKMKKTGLPIKLDIPQTAISWLPSRTENAKDTDQIFNFPKRESTIGYDLDKWSEKAGITNKRVTFHVSRHTFATLQLSLGTDLYTLSKLLGHRNIATTQIYATVMSKAKEEAMHRMNGILGAPQASTSTKAGAGATKKNGTDYHGKEAKA